MHAGVAIILRSCQTLAKTLTLQHSPKILENLNMKKSPEQNPSNISTAASEEDGLRHAGCWENPYKQ